MTGRDLFWRTLGALLVANAYIAVALAQGASGAGSILGLAAFLVAVLGLVLAVQGARVPQALRIERSRHRELPLRLRNRQRRGTRP